MSNSNPQLKEYIREQLTNRLFESVENISEAGSSFRTVPPASPRSPARSVPQGLNVALAAALGVRQAADSVSKEWKENKEKGMSDEENTEKTTGRAFAAAGIEATLAFALARAGQKMAIKIPITGKYKWAKSLRGRAGTLAGASLALGMSDMGDYYANEYTNRNEDPMLRQKALERRQLEDLERSVNVQNEREALLKQKHKTN